MQNVYVCSPYDVQNKVAHSSTLDRCTERLEEANCMEDIIMRLSRWTLIFCYFVQTNSTVRMCKAHLG